MSKYEGYSFIVLSHFVITKTYTTTPKVSTSQMVLAASIEY